MAVEQAHRLCVGLFRQKKTGGTAYAELKDADYKAITWETTSIIPEEYDFTNISRAGTTVETTERGLITDLSKITRYSSGKVTPGAVTFASVLSADAGTIHSKLRELTDVDDPYLCLLLIGALKEGLESTERTYSVFWASAGILTEDGAATAEANATFTGNLAFQPSGIPTEGITANAHVLKWDTGAKTITFSATPTGSTGSGD